MTYTEPLQGILVDFVKQHPDHPIFHGITRNLKKFRKLVHLKPKDIVAIVDDASLTAQHECTETMSSGDTRSGIYSALVTVRARADKGKKIDEYSFKTDTPAHINDAPYPMQGGNIDHVEWKRMKEREKKRKQRKNKKFRKAENERERKRKNEVRSKQNQNKRRRIATDEKKEEAKKKKRDYMWKWRTTKRINMTGKERANAAAKRREDWKNRTPGKKEADNKKKCDDRAKRTPEQVEADKSNQRRRIAGLRRARMEIELQRCTPAQIEDILSRKCRGDHIEGRLISESKKTNK